MGDLGSAMLTMFNICILAEWGEVVRPIWARQPHIVFLVFLPYLMLCSFGILNLIIGVIAEQTLEAGQAVKDAAADQELRDKMKAIMRMTDEMFSRGQGQMSKREFEIEALRHPDFVDLMRKCEFPRGFEVASLHLIFDESNEGHVDKEEFVNGMFRLVFNNLSQHACTILLGISQLKAEIKTHVEDQLEKVFDHITADPKASDGSGPTDNRQPQAVVVEDVALEPSKVELLEMPIKDVNLGTHPEADNMDIQVAGNQSNIGDKLAGTPMVDSPVEIEKKARDRTTFGNRWTRSLPRSMRLQRVRRRISPSCLATMRRPQATLHSQRRHRTPL